jgi:hypothetical protein
MAQGSPGADSSMPVTTVIEGKTLIALAQGLYGSTPVFWGRYFTSVATTDVVEYWHLKENQILLDSHIRVLPIARQTNRVYGTIVDGSADATANVEDLIKTFGEDYLASQGGKFFMFLDVEGIPSLSLSYFHGWANTLISHSSELTGGAVQILPSVYAAQGDHTTWENVAAACVQGAECRGIWVASWVQHGCSKLVDWNDARVTPTVVLPCKVLIWQYSDDCHGGAGFDCDEVSPSIDLDNDLLNQLILPPPNDDGVV